MVRMESVVQYYRDRFKLPVWIMAVHMYNNAHDEVAKVIDEFAVRQLGLAAAAPGQPSR